MIQNGQMHTCERCKKSEFVKCDENGAIVYPKGWKEERVYYDKMYLCPDCAELYKIMRNGFYDNFMKID